MTCQDLQDQFGFIVLAYQIQEEYNAELRSGLVHSETVNSSIGDGVKLGVIGVASAEEWARQCDACGDPVHHPLEDPHIGYLKVRAE